MVPLLKCLPVLTVMVLLTPLSGQGRPRPGAHPANGGSLIKVKIGGLEVLRVASPLGSDPESATQPDAQGEQAAPTPATGPEATTQPKPRSRRGVRGNPAPAAGLAPDQSLPSTNRDDSVNHAPVAPSPAEGTATVAPKTAPQQGTAAAPTGGQPSGGASSLDAERQRRLDAILKRVMEKPAASPPVQGKATEQATSPESNPTRFPPLSGMPTRRPVFMGQTKTPAPGGRDPLASVTRGRPFDRETNARQASYDVGNRISAQYSGMAAALGGYPGMLDPDW